MNARLWIIAPTFLFLSLTVAAQSPNDARIEGLVRKLGSPVYSQREQARKELQAIGVPALESLRRAAKNADAETAYRLGDLIRDFEEQLVTQQILAPKEVNLKLKDATVQEAIAELAKASGYPIQFLGDATKFADKKLTINATTSFWQALDRICKEADLVERLDLNVSPSQTLYPRIAKNGLRRPVYVPAQEGTQTGPITLTPRTSEKSLVNVTGALKTELRVARDEKKQELELTFIVSSEPRHVNSGLVGKPIFDRLVGPGGVKLEEAVEPAKAQTANDAMDDAGDPSDLLPPLRRFTQIRLKDDEEGIKTIKELAGKLTYQLDLQNEVLARIDNAMNAKGKSAPTKNGGKLRVLDVRRNDDTITVEVTLENTSASPFGNNIIINGGGGVIIRGNVNIRGGIVIGPGGVRMSGDGSNKDLPDLLDAKGQKYKVVNVNGDAFNFINGMTSRNASIQFQANPGQGEPRELVLYGTRTTTIAVPFRFENVPVP
jgi:hypothetical protein